MPRVRVGVRVRPFIKNEARECRNAVEASGASGTVQVNEGIATGGRPTWRKFSFDTVFDRKTSQKAVFERSGQPIVTSFLDGYNCTVFAYGQTSSGKTWTMMGDPESDEHKGLIPRTIEHLFREISMQSDAQGHHFVVTLSYLEIYNEKVYDLLASTPSRSGHGARTERASLKIRQQRGSGFYVQDLSRHFVTDVDTITTHIFLGNQNRSVAATSQNAESSRSHAVLTLSMERTTGVGDVKTVLGAKLHMVDLAGSERFHSTSAALKKESTSINQSLTCLSNCISALTSKGASKNGGKVFVPYRDSALTMLLKDSLGGNTHTMMFANVNPCSRNAAETVSTLRYAARAKNIKNTVTKGINPKDALLTRLQAEVKALKELLSKKDETISKLARHPSGDGDLTERALESKDYANDTGNVMTDKQLVSSAKQGTPQSETLSQKRSRARSRAHSAAAEDRRRIAALLLDVETAFITGGVKGTSHEDHNPSDHNPSDHKRHVGTRSRRAHSSRASRPLSVTDLLPLSLPVPLGRTRQASARSSPPAYVSTSEAGLDSPATPAEREGFRRNFGVGWDSSDNEGSDDEGDSNQSCDPPNYHSNEGAPDGHLTGVSESDTTPRHKPLRKNPAPSATSSSSVQALMSQLKTAQQREAAATNALATLQAERDAAKQRAAEQQLAVQTLERQRVAAAERDRRERAELEAKVETLENERKATLEELEKDRVCALERLERAERSELAIRRKLEEAEKKNHLVSRTLLLASVKQAAKERARRKRQLETLMAQQKHKRVEKNDAEKLIPKVPLSEGLSAQSTTGESVDKKDTHTWVRALTSDKEVTENTVSGARTRTLSGAGLRPRRKKKSTSPPQRKIKKRVVKAKPSGIRTPLVLPREEDTKLRRLWKKGSICFVLFSKLGWTPATVKRVYRDSEGEWLVVRGQHGGTKEISRYNRKKLRPVIPSGLTYKAYSLKEDENPLSGSGTAPSLHGAASPSARPGAVLSRSRTVMALEPTDSKVQFV